MWFINSVRFQKRNTVMLYMKIICELQKIKGNMDLRE